MKKETFCWETQSKHNSDIYKKRISPFPALFFSWKKILSEKQMLVKQNVLKYSYGLTFLLDFVFSVNPSIPETIEI
jgi:hypothetical protein